MRCGPVIQVMLVVAAVPAGGQTTQSDSPVDKNIRSAVLEILASKIDAAYVVPETGRVAVQYLRKANAEGRYDSYPGAKAFADKVTSDLRSVTKDKHLGLYFDPQTKSISVATRSPERFNYG